MLAMKFLNYTLILSINKITALILSTFNWKSEGGNRFSVIISYLLYCPHVLFLFYGFKVVPAQWSPIAKSRVWRTICYVRLPSSYLLNPCYSVAFCICCELNW
jgi:hypothetical protein